MKIINQKTMRLVSIISLYLCLLIFSIGIYQNKKVEKKTDLNEIIYNEKKIFESMKKIQKAQNEYYKVDWNSDGKKEYAQFLVHLWRTVDENAYPVDTAFISKKLGYAMGESKAIHGYFFQNIYNKDTNKNDHKKESMVDPGMLTYQDIDYEKEWAITAIPADYSKSGILTFVITNLGKIWAKDIRSEQINKLPEDLVPTGWKEIKSNVDIDILHNKK